MTTLLLAVAIPFLPCLAFQVLAGVFVVRAAVRFLRRKTFVVC